MHVANGYRIRRKVGTDSHKGTRPYIINSVKTNPPCSSNSPTAPCSTCQIVSMNTLLANVWRRTPVTWIPMVAISLRRCLGTIHGSNWTKLKSLKMEGMETSPSLHFFKNRVYLQSITGSVDLNSGHFMKLSTPILASDAVQLNQFKPTPWIFTTPPSTPTNANRISTWTCLLFGNSSKSTLDATGKTLWTGWNRYQGVACRKSNGSPLSEYGKRNRRTGNLPTMR